ncbi:D-alanyl-D-alanine carboxypeptidase [Lentilactobacillus hilgardii]|uniref:D-alanyl-D-alanine carboxypeptidase n=2 Tax=Lentilactobacillus hilgardii TaxID=1588 RepID=A0A6P1E991_LENHI|nr:D-alanyl-D-alanine carboxypeptidase [Lentilactobacillus hilgardii]QHB53169.1 D-alanyl-D-alanine carboxypeptidase [Lentilactobacillus hilgardii]RRG11309.1 MAG: D-alanyl-D-alanine carboxypeptidase [Lactobacillus sp.]
MKKKSLLLTTLITTLGVGVISVDSAVLTHASVRYYTVKTINRDNLPYHATTQRSAYVYNVSHTRKLHNLKNYPNTTWYVSKSLLMRSSYTGRKAVYYYVTSGNGRVNGIVWRCYLTAGTNPGASSDTNSGDSTSNSNSADNGGTNTGATGNNNSSTNSNSGTNSGLTGSSTTTYSTNSNQFNTKDVTAFNKQIIQLFPGLLEDQKLDDVASQDLELSNKYNYGDQETLLDKYIVQTYGGHPYGLLEDWNAVAAPNVSLVKKQVADPLSTIDYSDIEKYKGYHIGVASEAKSSSSNSSKITKIDYYIYILPANPKITLAS